MVNTSSIPSLRYSSSSMESIQFSEILYDDTQRASSRRQSPGPTTSVPSPEIGRDSANRVRTTPSKSEERSRALSKEFDFTLARTTSRRLDFRGGVMSLVKGCLGGGIMCIHESYMVCGLWTALPVNALLGLLLAYSMYELTTAAQKTYTRLKVETMSYPELAEAILEYGPWQKLKRFSGSFRHTVEVFICINSLCGCSVLQTMIARQMKQLVEGTELVSNAWPTVRVYIAVLLLPCLIISVFTSLKHLAPFSIIMDVFIVLLSVATMGYSALAAKTNPLNMPVFRSLDGLFELIGVSLFAMDGIVITLAVENNLCNPKMFPLVLLIGMSIVVSLVMVFGFIGYWGYGDQSLAPITINFPWGAFSIQLKMFLAIMAYITFALNFWVPSCLVWYYASYRHGPSKHWIWERVYRMLLVILTNIVALLVPSIAMFSGLVGSFCVSVLGLIFPAFIALTLEWEDPGLGKFCWRAWKAIFFILLGLTLCFIGTYANIRELVIYLTDVNNHGGFRSYALSNKG